MAKLTKKNEVFCEEYLIDLNATQAAIRAGYSVESAGSIGSELLKKPEIRARIETAMAERSKRTGINADRVLRELGRIAFVDPSDVIDMTTAEVKPDATPDDRAAIAGMKVKYVPHKDFDENGDPIIEGLFDLLPGRNQEVSGPPGPGTKSQDGDLPAVPGDRLPGIQDVHDGQ